MSNWTPLHLPSALRRKAIVSALVSVALLTPLTACNDREERMLALASVSQCNNAQPMLDTLMLHSQQQYTDRSDVSMALSVTEECAEGAKSLRKFYPEHPCLPFMDSSVNMADLAHQHFSGTRPLTSADRSEGRLAQNRAACRASNPGLMGG